MRGACTKLKLQSFRFEGRFLRLVNAGLRGMATSLATKATGVVQASAAVIKPLSHDSSTCLGKSIPTTNADTLVGLRNDCKIIIAKSWANQRRDLPGHAISSRQISLFPIRSELHSSLCGLLLPGHLYWLTTLLGFHEKPDKPSSSGKPGSCVYVLTTKAWSTPLVWIKISFQSLNLKFQNSKNKPPQKTLQANLVSLHPLFKSQLLIRR